MKPESEYQISVEDKPYYNWFVQCKWCMSQGPSGDSKSEAARRWNVRHPLRPRPTEKSAGKKQKGKL